MMCSTNLPIYASEIKQIECIGKIGRTQHAHKLFIVRMSFVATTVCETFTAVKQSYSLIPDRPART